MSFWPNNCAQLTTKGRHTARWSLVNLIFCCETSIVGFLKVFFFCFLPFTSNPLPSLPVGFPSYHRWVSLKSLVPVVISYHQQPLSLVSLPCHDIAQKKTLLASTFFYISWRFRSWAPLNCWWVKIAKKRDFLPSSAELSAEQDPLLSSHQILFPFLRIKVTLAPSQHLIICSGQKIFLFSE